MPLLQTIQFAACIGQSLPIPTWKAEKVEQLRQKRLRQLVGLAIDRSPFYREKYRRIDRNRFKLSDLPPCGKAELMANFDQVMTDPKSDGPRSSGSLTIRTISDAGT